MAFRCTPPTKDPVATLAYRPWELAIKPFQVAPQTWYVAGQTWVGCYLIDTGDGLILIDTAIAESAYMLVDSIYRLGYRPEQIKKILISHAHFDHCGAAAIMKKLTGAEMYMSKEDWEFMKACPKETIDIDKDSHPQYFEPDCFYSDEEPITLGNVTIHSMLTPGHTIGCTSFFWEVTNPANGERYVVGMHGGVGANTMNDKYYAQSEEEVVKAVQKHCEGLNLRNDAMYNVYATMPDAKGNRPVFMLDAHTDECGFMVQNVEDNGLLSIITLGGFHMTSLPAHSVIVRNSKGEKIKGIITSKPVHFLTAAQKADNSLTIEELKVDVAKWR